MDRANGPVQTEAEATQPRDHSEEFHSLVLVSRRCLLETAARALDHGMGLGLITGAAGSGKSWLAGRLPAPPFKQQQWGTPSPTVPPMTTRPLVVEIHPATRPRDLLARLLRQLGDPAASNDSTGTCWDETADSSAVFQGDLPSRLADLLTDQTSEGQRWSLLVEEAQNLSPAAAEVIRVLSNRIARPDGFASIWLIGQTPLVRLLRTRPYQPLETRLGCHLQLPPLTLDEARHLLTTRWPEANWHQPILERLYEEARGNPRALLSLAACEYHRLPRIETFGVSLPWVGFRNEVPARHPVAAASQDPPRFDTASSLAAGQPAVSPHVDHEEPQGSQPTASSSSPQITPQADELPRLLAQWFRDASSERPGTGIRIGEHSVEVGWGVGSDSDSDVEREEDSHHQLPLAPTGSGTIGESCPLDIETEMDDSDVVEISDQTSHSIQPTSADVPATSEWVATTEVQASSATIHARGDGNEDRLETVVPEVPALDSILWNRSPTVEPGDSQRASSLPAGGEVVGEEVVMDRYALIQAQNEWRLGGDLDRAWKAAQRAAVSRHRDADDVQIRSSSDEPGATRCESPPPLETQTASGPIRDVQPIGPGSRFGPTIWREDQQSFAPYGRLFQGRSPRGRD